jgi:Ca2+-binding RTX toxin-like protein
MKLFRWLLFGVFAVIVMTSMMAIAAANTVPPSQVDDQSVSYNVNHLKPSACSGIVLSNLVTGSGALTGTEGNDLIIASSGADVIDGAGGNDCILGGGGADTITGGDGNDVCLGGADIDSFTTCESEVQ